MRVQNDRPFAIKALLTSLQGSKHYPLQNSSFYWQHTIPNVSSIVGMLPGTHFVSVRGSLSTFSIISSMVWLLLPFEVILSLENRKMPAWTKSGE